MTQPQRFDQRTLHKRKGELAVALHVLNIEALHIALKVQPTLFRDVKASTLCLPSFARSLALS